MANLTVTVVISTPLPVSTRDLPKLEKLARDAAQAMGVPPDQVAMDRGGDFLILSFEMKAR